MWIIQGKLAWSLKPNFFLRRIDGALQVRFNVDHNFGYMHSWDPGGPGGTTRSSLSRIHTSLISVWTAISPSTRV
ncbi:hypothetical protein C4D60_Mb00t19900 [Musa balbisiana]|uniref:Uncharacterized protein ycf68 n=1 Tax=Musa balbisiana TaxID=52838 RepID=A0A4S8I3M5_MUSBA|nr:hypothetical protein C4D60_Mb00t19900 [Musa balbisiana]